MRKFTALLPGLLISAVLVAGFLWYVNVYVKIGPPAVTSGIVQGEGQADIGGPFSLIDHNGVRRTEADFLGKYTLIFFGYTYCPDICPTTLAVLSAALREMGETADRVVPVLVSVDPARDTPEVMRTYLSAFGPRFVGLTGSEEEIAEVARVYRVYYQSHAQDGPDYTVDHSSVIYLMGPDGNFITNYTLEAGPQEIAADVKRRIAEAE